MMGIFETTTVVPAASQARDTAAEFVLNECYLPRAFAQFISQLPD